VVAKHWLLFAALCACGASDAFAMSIRTERHQLARSPDGATLYEIRAIGPEGGGSLTYRVQGKKRKDTIDFPVSSDFSPGGPEQPQIVSAAECRQRVTALGEEIAKRKIPGVSVHPDACASENRDGVVTATAP
jgi:hypothetical protein